MGLARVKTWLAGDILTAADQNAEFNNILNNPITLVSPTTGAINFQTSVAHTNLQVSALTASSGFSGSVLVGSTAATPSPVWSTGAVSGGIFVATTASIPTWRAVGSSGQFLIAATSGTPVYSTGVNFVTTSIHLAAQRFANVGQGTALTSNNFSLSSGWGSTAVISGIAGTDQAYRLTVTVGATVSANPTLTTTFADGSWQTVPVALAQIVTNPGSTVSLSQLLNTSGQQLTAIFTPTTGLGYTFSVINFG